MKKHTGRQWWLCVGLAGGLILLAGCASSSHTQQGDRSSDPLELSGDPAEETPETQYERDFSLLEQAINQREDLSVDLPPRLADRPVQVDGISRQETPAQPTKQTSVAIGNGGASRGPVSVETAAGDAADADTDVSDGLAIGAPDPASAEPTIEMLVTERAAELAALLRQSGDGRPSPVGAMLSLAMLDAIAPGVLEAEYGPMASAAASMQLTDEERALVEAVLRASPALRAELDADFVDPEVFAGAIEDLADRMRSLRTLSLEQVKLCLRVDNFGLYKEVQRYDDRYKFLAGRDQRVIVYSELDHFTHTPSTLDGVAGFTVDVRQAMKMYRIGTEDAIDTESTLVWQLPPQNVTDFSRNRLKDFFIVQVIDLPRTLSVGSYRLKVIATDAVSGEQVEHGIEFDMVADANVLRGNDAPGGRAVRRDVYDPNN